MGEPPFFNTMHKVVDYILSHFPHQPTDGQRAATEAMAQFLYDPDPAAAFVLRGYAGTGKTSLVSALIQSAQAMHIKTVLLAPTGRAAKILSAYSGRPAYTIHKKIYQTVTGPDGIMRMSRAVNKHTYTLFIVDEASMIGLSDESGTPHRSLLDDLIDYVNEGSHCRLMLVGDTAQLPPVGSAESPALDLEYLRAFSHLAIRHCELTEVVRQQNLSGILLNATMLRLQIAQFSAEVGLPLFDLDDCPDVVRLSGADLEETLNREYSGDRLEQVAVITRSNKRANLFNQEIRNRILFREEEVNAGDYLMVVKNNYYWIDAESDVGFIANGDIVEVLSVRNRQELYGFHFVDATLRFVDYPESPTQDCKLLLETLHSESPSLTYAEMNDLAANAPVGSDGLIVLPFGNGAERVLENRCMGARFAGIDLVRHSQAHILRATQEGIAFSFRYGIDIMKDLGLEPNVIRAGKANLFLSPLFRSTLATLCDSRIELFNTDGALGAARGAALGAGYYTSEAEAFSTLAKVGEVEPEAAWKNALEENYIQWKENLK